MLLHLLVKETAAVADINRSFDFVSSQDPHLDPTLFERFNSFRDLLLEPVLDGRRANKGQTLFYLTLNCLNLFIFVDNRGLCGFKALIPLFKDIIFDFFVGEQQSSQAFLSQSKFFNQCEK